MCVVITGGVFCVKNDSDGPPAPKPAATSSGGGGGGGGLMGEMSAILARR